MTGTDRIKAKILEEAKLIAERNLSEANREAQSLISAAEKEALVRVTQSKEASEEEAVNRKKRMQAVASLEERKQTLKVRQDMVDKAFELALDKLIRLPDKEYGAIMKAFVIRSVREDSGDILLNQLDQKRLGQAFVKEVNDALKGSGKKAELRLSQDAIKAKGGFVLRYGDMEINSTLEILMNLLRPQLEVDIAGILFHV